MRETQPYTSTQYRRDNGFPLAWMCTCCISRSGPEEEAEEHFQQRNEERQGKVIGKPYKPQAKMVPQKEVPLRDIADDQKTQAGNERRE